MTWWDESGRAKVAGDEIGRTLRGVVAEEEARGAPAIPTAVMESILAAVLRG